MNMIVKTASRFNGQWSKVISDFGLNVHPPAFDTFSDKIGFGADGGAPLPQLVPVLNFQNVSLPLTSSP